MEEIRGIKNEKDHFQDQNPDQGQDLNLGRIHQEKESIQEDIQGRPPIQVHLVHNQEVIFLLLRYLIEKVDRDQ